MVDAPGDSHTGSLPHLSVDAAIDTIAENLENIEEEYGGSEGDVSTGIDPDSTFVSGGESVPQGGSETDQNAGDETKAETVQDEVEQEQPIPLVEVEEEEEEEEEMVHLQGVNPEERGCGGAFLMARELVVCGGQLRHEPLPGETYEDGELIFLLDLTLG